MPKFKVFGRSDARLKAEDVAASRFLDVLGKVETKSAIRVSKDRDAGAPSRLENFRDDDVVEIQLEGGLRIWTRGDRLAERLNAKPDRSGDGELELPAAIKVDDSLRGDGLVSIGIEAIRRFSLDLASTAAANEIAQKLEEKLEPGPGLYQCETPGKLAKAGRVPANRPILLLVHGTMSNTAASFGDLVEGGVWERLKRHYAGHVYALEHRTLSESPIRNTIDLLEELPTGAKLDLVTYSRGGLIGELLCRALREDVEADKKPNKKPTKASKKKSSKKAQADAFDEQDGELFQKPTRGDERQQDLADLKELKSLLRKKRPRVRRFVRVACPASGTSLASGRLDEYLSVITNLMGLIPALRGNPIYDLATAFLLAVVKQRTEPDVMPGLEAQMPESPFVAMVNRPDIKLGGELSVIAGDVEPSGILKRLAVLASDAFFLEQHDFVVNTAAMLGGSPRKTTARAFLARGGDVNHFRYYRNRDTSDAIEAVLSQDPAEDMLPVGFRSLAEVRGETVRKRIWTRKSEFPKPRAFIVPGLMGSHLSVDDERVWLNMLQLATGGIGRLEHDAAGVEPLAVIDRVYGDLADYLSDTHDVSTFPYDWRKSLQISGRLLAHEVQQALEKNDLPVRIIAHSMGGLVVQAMMHEQPGVWKAIKKRPGSRILLLGSPLRGSFVIPQVLLGQEETLQKLALLDITRSREEILRIVSKYQGLLELLPDAGDFHLFSPGTWDQMHRLEKGWRKPERDHLAEARELRTQLAKVRFDEKDGSGSQYVCYVAGCARVTPSQMVIDPEAKARGDRIRFKGTSRGDGRVTWETGPPPGVSVYYQQTVHGDMPADRGAFPAFLELLQEGETRRLTQNAPVTREADRELDLPPIPPDIFPDEFDLETTALGGSKTMPIEPRLPRLRVRVAHGNLSFATHPIAVGHYEGDLIVSAEEHLDHHLGGRLGKRHAVGLYPGPLNTADVVLNPIPERKPRGGIIVGLGPAGRLNPRILTATLANAALEYVMAESERRSDAQEDTRGRDVAMSCLLIGTGEGGLTLAEALQSMIQAFHEVNRRIVEAGSTSLRLTRIEFVELYEDLAVAALDVLERMQEEMGREELSVAQELVTLPGGRTRVYPIEDTRWWHRMQILGVAASDCEGETPTRKFESLHFQALTDRARVSSQTVWNQVLVVDGLIRDSIRSSSWSRDRSTTMFNLLLPNEIKDRIADQRSIELVVNESAARFPWELLIDPRGNGEPVSVNAGIVRRLRTPAATSRHEEAKRDTALVVGNPAIDMPNLPPLPGATAEANAVADLLERDHSFQVVRSIETTWNDVLNAVFGNNVGIEGYRILHLAGHGEYKGGKDDPKGATAAGEAPSGMVIGPDVYLGPNEVSRMRTVPDLVFINCCHLGLIDGKPRLHAKDPSLLAANLGHQFTKMGARAVIAAGWAVNDDAAVTFARMFYQQMLDENATFGEAVTRARKAVYDRHGDLNNTWGAYQCYGDHSFRLYPRARGRRTGTYHFSTPRQAIVEIENLSSDANTASVRGKSSLQSKLQSIEAALPARWTDTKADLRAALGKAHGQLGHFGEACGHLDAARAIEPASCPIQAIEMLANLRARHAFVEYYKVQSQEEARGGGDSKAVQSARNEAGQLIDSALGLLNQLVTLDPSSERSSLCGSAKKRLAAIQGGKAGLESLHSANESYEEALAKARDRGTDLLYPLHNVLSCMVLLRWVGPGRPREQHFKECLNEATRVARERDTQDPSFFSMTSLAEVLLIKHLWKGDLASKVETIVGKYENAWLRGGSFRAMDSVQEHLRCLRLILEHAPGSARNKRKRGELVEALREIDRLFGDVAKTEPDDPH